MNKEEQLLLKENSFLEKELAAKNRELEIEASLERVRARTMSMQKTTGFVEVIDEIGEQFISLGFDFDWVNFSANGIDVSNGIDIWNFVVVPGKYKGVDRVFIPYFDHPVFTVAYEKFKEYQATGNDFYALSLDKETKDKFAEHLFTNTVYKDLPDEFKKIHYDGNGYITSSVFLKDTWLSVGSYKGKPFTDEQNTILKRLANSFGQAYTRFLDLQKAEAQARESQIQLALERVRARTMAMQKSEELKEVIQLILEQFVHLGLETEAAGFMMEYKESNDINVWVNSPRHPLATQIHIPYFDHPIFKLFIEAKEKGFDFYTVHLSKEEKDIFFTHLFQQLPEFPVEWKQQIYAAPGYVDSHVMLNNIALYIQNYTGIPYSDADNAILMRFAKAFEQTYTRFLDLQKAEAQARESQIQLALERVRARTMAMEKSTELQETTLVLFQQFKALGATTAQVSICLFDEHSRKGEMFVTLNGEKIDRSFQMELYKETFVMNKVVRAFLNKEKSISVIIKGKRLQEYNRWRNQLIEKKGWDESNAVLNHAWYVNAVFFSRGMMGISSEKQPSDETINLLERFAAVFEQTYTRFQDLEKAESQVRESQIQLALERVRARTMAMQKSDELAETVYILFQQFKELGEKPDQATIGIINEDEKVIEYWVTMYGNQMNRVFKFSIDEPHVTNKIYKAWKENKTSIVIDLSGKELHEFAAYRESMGGAAYNPKEKHRIINVAFFSKGLLNVQSTEERSEESIRLLERFASVFEQTYTRFLDLQKAEAQAREAQIELGLERVRARAMAMHSSEELKEVVKALFEELTHLDVNLQACLIATFDEATLDQRAWMIHLKTNEPYVLLIPHNEQSFYQEMLKAWKEKNHSWTYILEDNAKIKWEGFLFSDTDFRLLPQEVKEGMQKPGKVFFAASYYNYGAIQVSSPEPFSKQSIDILQRFSKVFDSSYTRFLDLQKAEAQSRESQIQLALERVRARTMAMQKSDELAETASVLFQQMNVLGNTPERLNIGVINEEKGFIETWATEQGGNKINHSFNARLDEPTTVAKMYKGWKAKKTSMVIDLSGKELKQWIHFLQDELKMPVNEEILQNRRVQSVAYFKEGFILMTTPEPLPLETISLLERFAEVFNLTYTRFLDLQKAEAQAREAQIEAALERVRSRSLAMHGSNELEEVIMVVSEQLQQLQFRFHNASFVRYNKQLGMNFWLASPGQPQPYLIEVPYLDNPVFNRPLEAMKNGVDFIADVLTPEENHEWLKHLLEHSIINSISKDDKKYLLSTSHFARSAVLMKQIILVIGNYAGVPYTGEQNAILKRFGTVFEQAYTRFLDLQKAEAQAREAQIETALERVRSRSMAMQKSEELKDVIRLVLEQFVLLKINAQHAGFYIDYKAQDDMHIWLADPNLEPFFAVLPYFDTPTWNSFREAKAKGTTFHTDLLDFEEKNKFYNSLFKLFIVPEEAKQFYLQCKGLAVSTVLLDNVGLYIENFEGIPYSDEENTVLMRFGKVFQQTYTRFLDLQKAEMQAREAQIEAALERVRAKTMAMQKSDELLPTAEIMFDQLKLLGADLQGVAFAICDKNSLMVQKWTSIGNFTHPYNIEPGEQRMYEAWKNQSGMYEEVYDGEKQKKYYERFMEIPEFRKGLQKVIDLGIPIPTWQKNYAVPFNNGYVLFIITKPFEETQIFLRFGKVFEQTYTRFLDLQKAEAQAREAQIEAGLERVRSRAMAMQTSEELNALIGSVFTELTKLDLVLTRCVILIYEGNEKGVRWWMANSETPSTPMNFFVKYADLPFFNEYLKGWYNRELKWQYCLEGENKIKTDDFLFTETELSLLPDFVIEGMKAPDRIYLNASFNNFGNLTLATLEPLSEEHFNILLRFAKVFDLTYTRFNDLKQAEAQAREAQIEAALERVRGKAMAMHSSRDLADTIDVFYHEMELLSITPRRCGVGLMNKETHEVELSTMNTTEQGESIEVIGKLKLTGHPVLEGIYDNWISQKEYHPVLRGNEIKRYYQLIRPQIAYPDYPTDTAQYGYFFFFKEGGVYAWTEKELSEDELKIYRRFTTVLSLTYKRYKDLKDAEANAKEAVKRASLDRVRAETASMRTTGDLEKITPLIWNELTTLNVPFIRCGVFIMDEEHELIHSFLSTPEGKAIAAFQLPYQSAGELSKVLLHWHKNEMFKDHWDEATFAEWTKSLVEQGAIASGEKYSTTHRPVNLHLHFLPFLQGMLYVGSEAPLNEEEINLVQSLADAFSTAYARYEDFNKLESAKAQIEKTLVELKQAQAQLVQSEKMASLGELTAGIAHEIQNPLNFVNNFSDVNQELLVEMKDEMKKGNIEEADLIANDVIENEQKINHHGKRADAIVKGMLQHSRKTSGQKESTDINALADEYLRLSYHGLRAKDKTFNAEMKTNFDESIGKINIIPQDIGRVLLNIFNNAFYAVNQQKTRNPDSYKPTVSVTTMKCDDKVQIIVRDNGNGIPQNIADKIFQPFFTTKPTGEGTGLGLSLAYDIIKAHGGELKVESEDGEGSDFVIQLPIV